MAVLKNAGLVLFGTIVGAGLATYGGTSSQAVAAQGEARAQSEVCTMPVTGRYSPGALARYEGSVYRCFYVFGEGVSPAGVAWVKMSEQFSPREPSLGR
jgi:hypothetical protein